MPHNQRIKTNLFVVDTLVLNDKKLIVGADGTPDANVTRVEQQQALLAKEVLTLSALDVAVTDTGGADGGYGSQALLTLPAKNVIVLGAILDLDVVAAAGIGATGDVKFAIGTAAEATDDTLDGTQADVIASAALTLVASEGSKVATGTPQVLIDATGGTQKLYLNIGVADADISATSSVELTGSITLIYLDVS